MSAREIRRAEAHKARKLARKAGVPIPSADNSSVTDATPPPLTASEPNPVSSARLAANRANAQFSTGPKNSTVSSQNRTTHGLARHNGTFKLLASENPTGFEALKHSLVEEHQPKTETESILVNEMAQSHWLAERAQSLQTTCLDENTGAITNEKSFSLYLRYHSTHHRAFYKALNQLLKLRSESRKDQAGFEAQKQKEALQQMKIDHQQTRQDAFAHEAWQKKVHKDLITRSKIGKLVFDTKMRELKTPGFEAQFNADLQKQGFEKHSEHVAAQAA